MADINNFMDGYERDSRFEGVADVRDMLRDSRAMVGGTNAPRPDLAPSVPVPNTGPQPQAQPEFQLTPMAGAPPINPQTGEVGGALGVPMPWITEPMQGVGLPQMDTPQQMVGGTQPVTGGATPNGMATPADAINQALQIPTPQMGAQPLAPIPNAQTFTTPGGGTVTMPATLPSGRTAEDLQAQMEGRAYGKGQYTPEERERIKAELQGAGATQTQKERVGIRAIMNNLEKQGMDKGAIGRAIGWEQGGGMTSGEALRKLQALQTQRNRRQQEPEAVQRKMDKITEGSKRNEDGTPANDAARFEDLDTMLDGVGADPLSETTLRDRMTPSQTREYNRLMDNVASNSGMDQDRAFKRVEKFAKDIQRKDQQDYARKQAKIAKNELDTANKKAQTEAEQKWAKEMREEYKLLEGEVDSYLEASDKDRKEMMSEEQFKQKQNRMGEIMGSIANYNQGGGAPQGAGTGTATPTPMQQVRMRAPDGQIATVPQSSVQKYLDKGATIVE